MLKNYVIPVIDCFWRLWNTLVCLCSRWLAPGDCLVTAITFHLSQWNVPFRKQIIPVLLLIPISNRLPLVYPSPRPMIRNPTDRRLTEMLSQHFVRIGRPNRLDVHRHQPILQPIHVYPSNFFGFVLNKQHNSSNHAEKEEENGKSI